MAINTSERQLEGSADNPDRRGYNYRVTFDAGDTVVISFPYASGWAGVVWQITPASGATITVHGTNVLVPANEDWIEHESNPEITEATADTEEIAARHLRFVAAGAGAVLHISSMQDLHIGSAPKDLSVG